MSSIRSTSGKLAKSSKKTNGMLLSPWKASITKIKYFHKIQVSKSTLVDIESHPFARIPKATPVPSIVPIDHKHLPFPSTKTYFFHQSAPLDPSDSLPAIIPSHCLHNNSVHSRLDVRPRSLSAHKGGSKRIIISGGDGIYGELCRFCCQVRQQNN